MILPDLQIKQLFDGLLPKGVGSNLKGEAGVKFSGTFKNMLQTSETQLSGGGADSDIHLLAGFKGKKLLNLLEKYFLQNGLDPNTLAANDAALAAFKRLVVSAGFDAKQIDSLIEGLKAGAGKKGVRLSDLLKGVSELEDKCKYEDILEPSAFPFIESILTLLLPNIEKQHPVWQGVRLEGEGIDIARLILNLKNILKNLPDKGRTVPETSTQQQVAKLMNDMGIGSESGTVTLEKFVARLETLLSTRGPLSALEKDSAKADLKQLMQNIRPAQDLKKETFDLNGIDLGKAAVRDGVKNMTPLSGDKTVFTEAAVGNGVKKMPSQNVDKTVSQDPSEPANKLQALGKAMLTTEEPGAEIKPIENISLSGLKPIDPSAQPTAAEMKLPVRTLPAYVVNQVSRQIFRSYQNGTKEIRLQLNPPNLGRLQMNIDSSGEMLRVHIVTEQQSTQELLVSHAGELKSILTEQGLRLDKIDVQFDQYFEQSFSYARQESNRSNSQGQGGSSGRTTHGTASPEAPIEALLTETDCILDLVA